MVILRETLDHFLGGRVKLIQPAEGYRTGIDPIFLAASINAKKDECILDVGAGIGSASLFLAMRCQNIKVVGLEVQKDLIQLAQTNIDSNNLQERVEIFAGDLLNPPEFLKPNSFDQVMTNPPYYEINRARSSPILAKAQANVESTDLEKWLKACIKILKPKGVFTMIHRMERLPDILHYFRNRLGDIIIYPLWPGGNKPARRLLIQGRKGVKGEVRLSTGLTLHGETEKYTPEAEAILRHAKSLDLSSESYGNS